MKKVLAILMFLPLLAGCYAGGNGFSWFNGSRPDSITVRKGDTLYSLSRKYEVPLRKLIETNNLSAPYTLHIGQNLRLPARQIHTVAKGDTLYSISKKYNVDITSLSRANDLDSPYILSVGQVLTLPETLAGTTQTAQKTPVNAKTTAANQKTSSVKMAANSKKIAKSAPQKSVSTYRKTKFMWPVNGKVVSNFGLVGKGRKNDGINIKAAIGTNVKAADKGIVAYAGNELKGFGNLVLIKHSDGYITAYAHNDRLYVKKGQKVLRCENIATVGRTGSVNTPQLHFEVRAGKKAVNPRSYLP